MSTYRLDLPHGRPPLTLNQRLHWAARSRTTRELRQTVTWLAKAAQIPAAEHVTVTLHYAPGDNRRRDDDNLVATSKVCCDAIVDSGVVPDDTPAWMTKPTPVIVPPPAKGMWLTVEVSHG